MFGGASRFLSKNAGLSVAMGVAFGGLDYTMARNEGKSPQEAMGVAVGYGLLYGLLPQVGMALTAYDMASATQGVFEYGKRRQAQGVGHQYYANFGQGFSDSQNRATMRQRSLQHLQNSRMNAQSVLGREARSIHYGFNF